MSEFFKRAPAFRAGCLARPALQSAFICILVFAISMTMAAINPVYASGTVASQPPLPLYTGGVWTYHAISAFGGGRWIEPPQPTPEQACGLVTAQAVNLGYSSPYSESTTRSVSLWVGPYSYQTIIIPWAYCFASYGGVSYGLGNMEANAGCPAGYQPNGGATSFATDYCIRLSDANRCPANSAGTPAANPTTCTCIDPNVPDATGTSCVTPATNCPPNASGSPCACIAGYSPYPYFSQMGCYLPAACPANSSGSPCTCNAGYVSNPAGAGCVQEQFIISEPQDEAQLPDVEPGLTRESSVKVVSVQTKLPKQGAVVTIHLDVDTSSGGHDHGETYGRRPRGSITGCAPEPSGAGSAPDTYRCTTGDDGYAKFTFNAPDVSGKHAITTTCISPGCSDSKTAMINVKVGGLEPIPASEFYALTEADGSVIGAHTGWHTDNHNMTPAAAAALWQLAARYRFESRFQLTPLERAAGALPRKLHLNDASLPWGGVYDICARPGACTTRGVTPWIPPHHEHRRGTMVDVRANGKEGAIPAGSIKTLFKLMLNGTDGISYIHEDQGTSNEHFHIRFSRRME